MAKREEPRPSKSKMTVLVFQLEGSDETIQEGLRKIGQTVDGMMRPPPRALALKSNGTVNAAPSSDAENNQDEEPEVEADVSPENGHDELDVGDDAATSRRRPSKDRPPQVVDFDPGKASVSFKEYCEQKAAGDSVDRRYLVAALWWKDCVGTPSICMDHVWTCFKMMNWTNFPAQGGQPFRRLKSKKGAFTKQQDDETGYYRINHIGENMVNDPNI